MPRLSSLLFRLASNSEEFRGLLINELSETLRLAGSLSEIEQVILDAIKRTGEVVVGQSFGGKWTRALGYYEGEKIVTVRASTLKSLGRKGLVTLAVGGNGDLYATLPK